MLKNILFAFCILFSVISFSQESIKVLLEKFNTQEIPYIHAHTLYKNLESYILLDTRELTEYNTSHIKNAILVGYNNFNTENILKNIPNKNQKIVVYCSVGIRSEKIGLQLKKFGYHNVYNLFGGIFEWKKLNNTVYNYAEKETDSVHVFSKKWSKWLQKGIAVYD